MSTLEYSVGVFTLVISVFLIVVIMLQESNTKGLASVTSNTSSSFYNTKSKGRTTDAKLTKLTKISAVLLMLAVTVLGFLYNYKSSSI
jgi:preprotein translocase subunit SecG